MEGQYPHPLRDPSAHQAFDPVGHLASGLVGERDRQDRTRRDALPFDHVCDAMGYGAGLARTGPGNDENGPVGVQDGLALDGIQRVQEGFDFHRGIVGAGTDLVGGRQMVGPEDGKLVWMKATEAEPQTASLVRKPALSAGFVLRGLGRLCLVAAAVVAGYLVWMMWGTGIITSHAQAGLRAELAPMIANPQTPPSDPSTEPISLAGDAYAEIVIPRISLDMIVVQGTDTASLMKGPGHYPHTADPWDDTGRVAIAGHRTTYLHPFWSLDKMQPGDLIRLATEFGTFDYRVTETRIVAPTATQVADPTEKPTLILTTCNPRFSASQRLVVFAGRLDQPAA